MGSAVDFFAAIDDVDDDLLEMDHHQHSHSMSHGYHPDHDAAVRAASTSAHELLARMLQQQQQLQHQQQLQQPAASPARPSATTTLGDGLMRDEMWTGGDVFDGIVGSPDQAAPLPLAQRMPFQLPPPPPPPQPTMADLAAAFLHGRATGAASMATNPFLAPGHGARPSTAAAALTANLATANALATTEALNAQLLRHVLGGGAGAAAPTGPPAWTNPPPAPAPAAPFLPSPSLGNARPSTADYLAQLLTSPQPPVTAQAAASGAAARRLRDAETVASLLESRAELERATSAAAASAAPPQSAAATNPSSNTSGRPASAPQNNDDATEALLAGLMDFEDSLSGDGADSIGTVDPFDSDDEDGGDPLFASLASSSRRSSAASHAGRMVEGMAVSASGPTASASTGIGSSGNAANNNGGDLPASTSTASPEESPARRSRRQAAARGLERISAALATHGMGVMGVGGSDGLQGGIPFQGESPPSKPSRKRPTATIDLPSSPKDLAKKKAEDETKTTKAEAPPPTCCICLDEPTRDALAKIDGCDHPFCFGCIEKWADQENTCPLCKARFHTIDKVHMSRKRRGAEALGGEPSSKRVRHRDQRADAHSFVNPLEGIFASMEANGTWPTHIAQLLFSGLGASSLGGGRHRSAPTGAGRTASSFSAASSSPSSAIAAAAARRQQQQRQAAGGMPFRYQPPAVRTASAPGTGRAAAGSFGGVPGGSGHPGPGGGFPPAVGGPRDPLASPAAARPRPAVRTATATMSAAVAPRDPFAAGAAPWSASASVSVTVGPPGFAGRTSSASTASYRPFPSNPNPRASMTTSAEVGSPFLGGGEEEELLSTLSPSSYIQRLHRELERGASVEAPSGQYRFNAAGAAGTSGSRAGVQAPAGGNPFNFSLASSASASNQTNRDGRQRSYGANGVASSGDPATRFVAAPAVGRSMDTVLEITESDDDDEVVEVIDVEALI